MTENENEQLAIPLNSSEFNQWNLEVRAHSSPSWSRMVELLIRCGQYTAEPILMQKRPFGMPVKSSLEIEPEVAQVLMDDLWRCGLRPTEGSGSAGALAATERHLEDMRTLVFEKRDL